EPDDGCRTDHPREHEGLAVRELARHERTLARALHDPVDVPVDVAVECAGRTGTERATDERGEHEPQVGDAPLRQNHHGRRGHEQELDDPWFRQRDIRSQLSRESDALALDASLYSYVHHSSYGVSPRIDSRR